MGNKQEERYIYCYCIVQEDEEKNLGPIGIGGESNNVFTVPYQDFSMMVSFSRLEKYPVSRANILTHERVIQKAQEEYQSVLPVRFCTITNIEELREVLRIRSNEIRRLLQTMEGKVEIGVQVSWRELPAIYREIADEDIKIRALRDKIFKKEKSRDSQEEKLSLGQMVQVSLEKKREKEAKQILSSLDNVCVDCRENKIYLDQMVLNGVFLVERSREKEFDSLISDLDQEHMGRYLFKRGESTAPFNFVNIQMAM